MTSSGAVSQTEKRRVRFVDEPAVLEFILVRMRGLEPPRCHHHRLLRPARLPVPPHPQGTDCHYANGFRRCQPAKELCEEGALSVDSRLSVVSMPMPITVTVVTMITSRPATIPTAVACVMAVNKLAALFIEPVVPAASTTALAQRGRSNTQPEQQHQGRRANQFSCG